MSIWNSPFSVLPTDGQEVWIRVISVYGELAEAVYSSSTQVFTVDTIGSEIPLYMVSRWKEKTPSPPSTYLLDVYTGAKSAYSVFKLSENIEYPFQVTRSSDNAILDVPFSGDYVDISALTTFIGSDNCYVSIIYDQSGNLNHQFQGPTTSQPYVASAGVLHYINSLLAFDFNGSTRYCSAVKQNFAQPITSFYVGSLDSGISAGVAQVIRGSDVSAGRNLVYKTSTDEWSIYAGTEQKSAVVADTNQHLFTALFSGASSKLRLDAVEIISANAGTFPNNGILQLGRHLTGAYWNGSIQLAIDYDSDMSADFTDIETYINTLFTIY